MEWKRDWGLTGRIVLTGFLLLILYIVFMGILLFLFPTASYWLFVILAVGMASVQYFFSDKLVLWSTGARVLEKDEYPELHQTVEKLCKEADLPHPKDCNHAESGTQCICNGKESKARRCRMHRLDHASFN